MKLQFSSLWILRSSGFFLWHRQNVTKTTKTDGHERSLNPCCACARGVMTKSITKPLLMAFVNFLSVTSYFVTVVTHSIQSRKRSISDYEGLATHDPHFPPLSPPLDNRQHTQFKFPVRVSSYKFLQSTHHHGIASFPACGPSCLHAIILSVIFFFVYETLCHMQRIHK